MKFSDTSTKLGLIQDYEKKIGASYGDVSGDSEALYEATARINRAQDRFHYLAMSADGRWQFADDNDTELYIATANMVSNQRDYTFSLEHLEIEKVLIKDSGGTWALLDSIDQNDPEAKTYLENNSSNTGTPTKYDKRGSSLIFDKTPNYSLSNAIKVYFKKGPNYYVYTDTTKVPGFASIFHGYLSLHAATHHALEKGLSVAKNLFDLLQIEEQSIQAFYSKRNRDERPRLRVNIENTR